MNLTKALACCAILAAPVAAVAQDAAGYNNPCAGIQWSHEFLATYPKAPAACQTVETKDGMKYAQFKGQVVSSGADSVVVNLVNVAGTAGAAIAWHWDASADESLLINDKDAKVSDLKKGDTVTFYVEEKKFTIFMHPGGKPLPITKLGAPHE
jgi:hypothetical protein